MLNNKMGLVSGLEGDEERLQIKKRYKAKIANVSPSNQRELFEKGEGCFLGVSLENSNFQGEKLSSIVEWIARRFSKCTVLIGDSIHRLTLQSNQSITPANALSRALEIGESFRAENFSIFEAYNEFTHFDFVTCKSVQESKAYSRFHRGLIRLFDEDESFKRSVQRFGRNYHSKKPDGTLSADLNDKISMSVQYFLEEFAVFSCLRQQGHSVMIYPGSFSTLSEIADGLHPKAPAELNSLIIVSLCIKGR